MASSAAADWILAETLDVHKRFCESFCFKACLHSEFILFVQGHNGMVAGLAFTQDAARLASLGSSERLAEWKKCRSILFDRVLP